MLSCQPDSVLLSLMPRLKNSLTRSVVHFSELSYDAIMSCCFTQLYSFNCFLGFCNADKRNISALNVSNVRPVPSINKQSIFFVVNATGVFNTLCVCALVSIFGKSIQIIVIDSSGNSDHFLCYIFMYISIF